MALTYDNGLAYDLTDWNYEGLRSNFPVIKVEIGFSANPLDALSTVTWTNVSDQVRSFSIRRGRQHELSQFTPGTAFVTLNNRTRNFDPTYTSGSYHPNVKPLRRIRISGSWDGTDYTLFTGYIEAWDQRYNSSNDAVAEVRCVDAFKILNLYTPERSAYTETVLDDTPDLYYTFSETVGATCEDISGNSRNATYTGTIGRNIESPITADPTPAAYFFGPANRALLVSDTFFDFERTDTFTFAFWCRGTSQTGIARRHDAADNFKGWQVTTDTDGKGVLEFRLVNTFGSNEIIVQSQRLLLDGEWHLCHITYDGSSNASGVTLYIDGTNAGLYTVQDTLNATTAYGSDNLEVASNTTAGVDLKDFAVWKGTVLTAAQVAAHYEAGVTPWNNQRSSDRITELLDLVGWPSADRDIQTGVTTLDFLREPIANPLEHAQQVALTEAGAFYVAADGKIRFDYRYSNISDSSSVATFGDTPSENRYTNVEPTQDDADLWNEIHARRPGSPTTQVKKDASSQTSYGKRVLEQAGLWIDDNQAQAAGDKLLARYKDPQTRFTGMALPQTPDLWPQILGRELHRERITVKRRPLNVGSAMSQECWIEAIDITAEPGRWFTRWTLVPAETSVSNYFTLNTSTLAPSGTDVLAV